MKKRLLCTLLALVMLFSLMPATARAEETVPPCDEHIFGEWIVTEYPDGVTTSGCKVHRCTICGAEVSDSLTSPEIPHEDGQPITVTANDYGYYQISITQARAGHEVFLQIYSSEKNPLEQITFTTESGTALDTTLYDDGYICLYAFIMPDEPLYIDIEFKPTEYFNVYTTTGEGGKVSLLECEQYEAGNYPAVIVTPDEGYTLDTITAVTASGVPVELRWQTTNYYDFIMPAEDVYIEVTFKESEEHVIEVFCTAGGSYNLSSSTAKAGDTVILSVYPDAGYWIDQVLYLLADENKDLEYGAYSDNELYFIMPDCDVFFEIRFILSDSPFSDVKSGAYYYEPVLWAVSNNITSGVSATKFGPNNSCTRAQVVTFLWRTAGSPDPVSTVNPFTDVKPSDYYYKAVLWAVENGITSGVSATQFGPKNICTRAQVVTFLWRAVSSPQAPSDFNPFVDVPENAYYHDAVLFAVQYGITSGVSDTRFGSGNTCTRAHVVTFLYKTFHG